MKVKKNPSFVAISEIGQERIIEETFLIGDSYYIMKPFDYDVLMNCIQRLKVTKQEIRNEIKKMILYEKNTDNMGTEFRT